MNYEQKKSSKEGRGSRALRSAQAKIQHVSDARHSNETGRESTSIRSDSFRVDRANSEGTARKHWFDRGTNSGGTLRQLLILERQQLADTEVSAHRLQEQMNRQKESIRIMEEALDKLDQLEKE